MLSAGIFGWGVAEKNHEVLQAAYKYLAERIHEKETHVEMAFFSLGNRTQVQDDQLGYISVYTKEDGSAHFFGIPSRFSRMSMLGPSYPNTTENIEVQFQYDPSHDSYQAVVFGTVGNKLFTFAEQDYSYAIEAGPRKYGVVYGDGHRVEDLCRSHIASALKTLGQCKEEVQNTPEESIWMQIFAGVMAIKG